MSPNTGRTVHALALGVLVSCSQHDETHQEPTAYLRVRSAAGATIETFVASITDATGHTKTSACNAGVANQGTASCANGVLQMGAATGGVTLTIKAHGYTFFSGIVEPTAGTNEYDVSLNPIAPFEHTQDYDTGFEAENGIEAFNRDAVADATEVGQAQIVKFYITDLKTSPKVYFQNTRQHPLHYGFARDVLLSAGNLSDFETATYHGLDRNALAGSLVYRPQATANSASAAGTLTRPLSVTFFPSDDLTPEQALLAHRLIEERLGFTALSGLDMRVVYEPAGVVQEAQLAVKQQLFVQAGSLWMTLREIYGSLSLQVLNTGLSYGTLRLMTPEELDKAVVSYTDLLVLTRLPTKLPLVGGTITEEFQTPLSHVNVAARSRGTPNIALKNASKDPRITARIGKLVRFEVKNGDFSLTDATADEVDSFWKGQTRQAFVPTYDDTTQGLADFTDSGFADASRVGTKAANLAELSKLLPTQAPAGFSVPFFYYNQFMQTPGVTAAACAAAYKDCISEKRAESLCAEVRALCEPVNATAEPFWDYIKRVLPNTQVCSDSSLREASLDALRHMMRHTPVDAAFATLLDQRVTSMFGAKKVRIRSSTNAEDLENFSGAGLYDSFSANTAEDGAPSKQIRKTWASVWNFSAYEERSYWHIDHLAVRMGCAIHQAFSDEAANGVVITQNIADPAEAGMYVNVQLGEISVTNPTNGSIPEIFSIVPAPNGVQVVRQRFSSLSPEQALLSDAEVLTLYRACSKVQTHFASLYQQSDALAAFDIEFKFNEPDRSLILKQVRPYAVSSQ